MWNSHCNFKTFVTVHCSASAYVYINLPLYDNNCIVRDIQNFICVICLKSFICISLRQCDYTLWNERINKNVHSLCMKIYTLCYTLCFIWCSSFMTNYTCISNNNNVSIINIRKLHTLTLITSHTHIHTPINHLVLKAFYRGIMGLFEKCGWPWKGPFVSK